MTRSTNRRVSRVAWARRLLALMLLGWLGVALGPAIAGVPSMGPGMEHCDHGGTPQHPLPCPEMRGDNCVVAGDLNADAPRPAQPARVLSVPAPLAADLRPRGGLAGGNSPHVNFATGPPLVIRFCTLRN